MMRLRLRVVVLMLVMGLLGSGCSEPGEARQTDQNPVAAAELICPVMWTWVTDVGEVFNRAAAEVGDIADIDQRRDRWEQAFTEIEVLDAALLADLAPLANDPILAPLVAEVERDMPRAQQELDDIRRLFVDQPEVDQERHQIRTSQIIVRVEKVIDLPKPDLIPLDPDGTLLPAFRQVPACQHAIRDVDDGTPQFNG